MNILKLILIALLLSCTMPYEYPTFYRGIYLSSTRNLETYIDKAKASYINCFVIDIQGTKISEEQLCKLKDNGIHPIARVVVFPSGLKQWPISNEYIDVIIGLAEQACQKGFPEIQFDYIRFSDYNKSKLSFKQRYEFIENILLRARKKLKKYNVRIAADIFGRIPLRKDDLIGQNMESLDGVVDVICPMAYPSHYTWSKKFYLDPYYTVYITSKKAKERVKQAIIVSYIQGFKLRTYNIPFNKYLIDQLRAIHDSGINGFILWNARNDYDYQLKVIKGYYDQKK